MLYSGFYKGRIKHGGQLWAFQTASFRLSDTLICVLEAEPVPAALTQAVGRGLVDEDAEIDAALPVGSPPHLWSAAFLPCVLTYFFFQYFGLQHFMVRFAQHNVFFPPVDFLLLAHFSCCPHSVFSRSMQTPFAEKLCQPFS